MAKNSNTPLVPSPIERDPLRIVENIFPDSIGNPDYHSADLAAEYLQYRLEDEPRPTTRLVAVPTGTKLPTFIRVDAVKHRHNYSPEGWIKPFTPKFAAGVMLASAVLSVAKPAVLDAIDEVKELRWDIESSFGMHEAECQARNIPVPIPGKVTTIERHIRADNLSGAFDVDKQAVKQFGGQVAKVVKKGGDIISVDIEVIGHSSDDFGSNESIGNREPLEFDFADERANAYATALEKLPETLKVESGEKPKISTSVDQNVLTPKQKKTVISEAKEAGFTGSDNIIDAINAVENNQKTTPKIKQLINKLFTDKRGVTLRAKIVNKSETTFTTKQVFDCADPEPPANPDRDYGPWFIPMLPLPRIRRYAENYMGKKWKKIPGKTIYKYGLLREQADQKWIQIRPEARKEDGSLVDSPWAYTRKYEHLLRDNRIVDMLRADFTTKEGDQKSLRVMFVDRSPSDDTVDFFGTLMKRIVQMEDGKVADRISGIFIYPTENAGKWHNNPKKIGLHVDKQTGQEVLGAYTPLLDLVEMHMPNTWNREQVKALFSSFYGPGWTFAHEVAGHGTDDSDADLRLRPVRAFGITNAHIIEGDPWAHTIQPVDSRLKDLPKNSNDLVEFDIEYSVPDKQGKIVNIKARVFEGDPRLEHAISSTIVRHKVSEYGSTNDLEHYAETAAAVTTGNEVPYAEADLHVATLSTTESESADFAKGYRPAKIAQKVFTDKIGAVEGSYPVVFPEPLQFELRHINPLNDKLIQKQAIRARKIRFPSSNELLSVLARVTFARSKRG